MVRIWFWERQKSPHLCVRRQILPWVIVLERVGAQALANFWRGTARDTD